MTCAPVGRPKEAAAGMGKCMTVSNGGVVNCDYPSLPSLPQRGCPWVRLCGVMRCRLIHQKNQDQARGPGIRWSERSAHIMNKVSCAAHVIESWRKVNLIMALG